MKKTLLAAATACTALMSAMPVLAETPHAGYSETGQSKDWIGIYSPDRGVEKPTASCAIYARPVASEVFEGPEPVEAMRGELAAFLSWNGEEITNRNGVISFLVGMPVAEGRNDAHGVTIDGKTRFGLIGVGDRLYMMPEDDRSAVAALRAGSTMVVTAKAQDGKLSKDSYSLMGVVGMTDVQKSSCN